MGGLNGRRSDEGVKSPKDEGTNRVMPQRVQLGVPEGKPKLALMSQGLVLLDEPTDDRFQMWKYPFMSDFLIDLKRHCRKERGHVGLSQ